MGLRADAERDLAEILESEDDFGIPVVLMSPEGVIYSVSANDPTSALRGRVTYDTLSTDEAGNAIIEHKPQVYLRRTSLQRVPAPGENWAVKIPISPVSGAPIQTFMVERAADDGQSLGFICLYLRKASQS